MIESKKVTRHFATYMTWRGKMAKKGFGSKMAACRFLAKQIVLDEVFGPKVEHDGDGYSFWMRDVPDLEGDRIKKWAAQYPIETCDGGGIDYYGYEHECSFGCAEAGYAKCQVSRNMADIARNIYWGRHYDV